MKIRTKLAINVLFVILLIIGMIAISIWSFRYIRSQLWTLTERSTPYQIRTLDFERSLQVVISELIKVFPLTNLEELKRQEAIIGKNLEDLRKKQAKLEELLGGEKLRTLEEVTLISEEIIKAKELSIKAKTEAEQAGKQVSTRAKEVNEKLRNFVELIRSLQLNRSALFATALENTREVERRIRNMEGLKIHLKDAQLAINDLLKVQEGRSFLIMRSRAQTIITKIKESSRAIPNRALTQELTTFINKFEELLKVKQESLEKPQEALQRQLKDIETVLAERLNVIFLHIEQDVVALREKAQKEIESQEFAFLQNNLSNIALQHSTELLSYGIQFESIAYKILNAGSLSEVQKIEAEGLKLYEKLSQTLKNIEGPLKKLKLEREIKQLHSLASSYEVFRNLALSIANLVKKKFEAEEKVQGELEKLKNLAEAQRKKGEEKITLASTEQEKALSALNKTMKQSIHYLIISGFVIIALGILFGLWIYRSVNKPLSVLAKVANSVAEGYLTCGEIKITKDEVGKVSAAICSMIDRVADIISKLQQVTDQLSEKAEILSDISKSLNKASDVQFLEIEQSTASITELSITASNIADNAKETANYGETIEKDALKGKETINYTIDSLTKFTASVEASVEEVTRLAEHSKEINSILELIRNISDQIKLLALNATIEAARAGTYGKGFAVVAENIRQLAIRTAGATDEINEKISNMLRTINSTVQSLQKEREVLKEVYEFTNSALKSMDNIVDEILKITEMIKDVAIATEQQREAIDNINRSMIRISQLSNEVKKSINEVRETSIVLGEAGKELRKSISWFKI
ncbi:MAG: methyl-accepting chemotaxis protein [Caldimicrobium sp.]|nr:methyl-accepting chemotaxis protein [Caldimicrobium sp.]